MMGPGSLLIMSSRLRRTKMIEGNQAREGLLQMKSQILLTKLVEEVLLLGEAKICLRFNFMPRKLHRLSEESLRM